MPDVGDDFIDQAPRLVLPSQGVQGHGEPCLRLDLPSPVVELCVELERPPVRRFGLLEAPLPERQVAQPGQGGGVLGGEAGGGCGGHRLLGQRPGLGGVAGRLGQIGEHLENLGLTLLVTLLDEQAA